MTCYNEHNSLYLEIGGLLAGELYVIAEPPGFFVSCYEEDGTDYFLDGPGTWHVIYLGPVPSSTSQKFLLGDKVIMINNDHLRNMFLEQEIRMLRFS